VVLTAAALENSILQVTLDKLEWVKGKKQVKKQASVVNK
jgi:hypothetical protein